MQRVSTVIPDPRSPAFPPRHKPQHHRGEQAQIGRGAQGGTARAHHHHQPGPGARAPPTQLRLQSVQNRSVRPQLPLRVLPGRVQEEFPPEAAHAEPHRGEALRLLQVQQLLTSSSSRGAASTPTSGPTMAPRCTSVGSTPWSSPPRAASGGTCPPTRHVFIHIKHSMLVTTGGRNDAVLGTTASILGTTGPILGSRDTLLPSSVSLSDADLQYRVETDETGRILDIHPQLEKSREHGGRDQVEGAIIDLEVIEDTMEEDSNDVLDSAVLNSTGGVLEGGEELSLQLLNQMDISQVYICPWCDRVFRTEKDRIDHLLTGHGVEVKEDITVAEPHDEETGRTSKEPRSCSVCEKKFSKPSQLKRHMRIHTGERPFACLMCMKSFNQKNALQIHMKKHTGEWPYICPFCQYAFTQKGNLKTHISRSHVNEAQEYMQDDQAGLLQDGPTLVTGGDTSGAVSIDVSDLFGQN